MLKFVWRAEHAGAPDHDGYDRARDRLYQRDDDGSGDGAGEREVQAFAKSFTDCPAPDQALTGAVNG